VRDIYDAAERQSAALAMSLETLARRRGWGVRTLSGMLMDVPPGSGRMLMIYGASVLLPGGRAASFIPAPRPRVDNDSWVIDVRRSDGASRPEWNPGFQIKKLNGAYQLFFGTHALNEALLDHILDAMGQL
jgi:hypothetical protein